MGCLLICNQLIVDIRLIGLVSNSLEILSGSLFIINSLFVDHSIFLLIKDH